MKIYLIFMSAFLFSANVFCQDISDKTEKYSITVDKKQYSVNRNKENKSSWRMVYNEKEILWAFESCGYTCTKDNLFIASTEEDCKKKVNELKFEYPILEQP